MVNNNEVIEAIADLKVELRISTLAQLWLSLPQEMDPSQADNTARSIYRVLRKAAKDL